MSRPPGPRPSLAAIQWLVASTVAVHAALVVFAPDAGWGTAVAAGAVAGLVLSASPVRWGAGRRRRIEALLGGLALALAVPALGLLLAALGAEPDRGWGWWGPWAAVGLLALADVRALARVRVLVGVEWLKTRHSRLLWMALLVAAAATLLAALTYEALPDATGWTLVAHTLGTGFWAAEVFLLVLGAIALSGEATGGTLKMILPHAYRRSDWVLAKALVVVLVGVLLAVVVGGVAIGHAAATEGLGDVTRELEPMFGEAEGTTETFLAADAMREHLTDVLVAGLVALVATGLLGVLLSCVFDGVVASLCGSFLLFAGLKFADVVLRLPRETLEGIYAWPPSEMRELLGKLGRAINERWDETLAPTGLELGVLTAIVALLLGIRALARDLQS